jgi:hypothetical protein
MLKPSTLRLLRSCLTTIRSRARWAPNVRISLWSRDSPTFLAMSTQTIRRRASTLYRLAAEVAVAAGVVLVVS